MMGNNTLTAHDLWRTIASFGSYLNRKEDGPPGWQTFWKGWLYLQTVLQGVRLAVRFSPPYIVLHCQAATWVLLHCGATFSIKSSTEQNNSSKLIARSLR
jgi:hypothetical protein